MKRLIVDRVEKLKQGNNYIQYRLHKHTSAVGIQFRLVSMKKNNNNNQIWTILNILELPFG